MAGRKRNSAEDIVRKVRRADELPAAGNTQEEIAAELDPVEIRPQFPHVTPAPINLDATRSHL